MSAQLSSILLPLLYVVRNVIMLAEPDALLSVAQITARQGAY